MSQENVPNLKIFMLGVGVFATLGIGGAGVYMARQAAALTRSSDDLVQELKSLRANLASQPTPPSTTAALARAPAPAGEPETAAVVTALREALAPLSKQVAELDASIRRQSAVRSVAASVPPGVAPVPPPFIPPPLPRADGLRQGRNPAAQDAVPKETRERIDAIFQRNSEDVRNRIAAETDPERPDPEVLMRVMSQAQAELASDLSGVMPQEEYDVMFPSMGAGGPTPGGSDAAKGKQQK
ncbi:hypothetical protein [uncultured Thiodictyon sp.]|uniref:hypothetical protein n=1 Tax=uncultured Thiodictyon sp. TaxID=1846217 RepID=UPI0025D31E2E|nr:hypothetical protein [uncultured Thiodictyon sp.]